MVRASFVFVMAMGRLFRGVIALLTMVSGVILASTKAQSTRPMGQVLWSSLQKLIWGIESLFFVAAHAVDSSPGVLKARELCTEFMPRLMLLGNLTLGLRKAFRQQVVVLVGLERLQHSQCCEPTRVFRVAVGFGGTQFECRMALTEHVRDLRALIKGRFPQGSTHELALFMGSVQVADHWGDVSCLHADLTGVWVEKLPAWEDLDSEDGWGGGSEDWKDIFLDQLHP